MDSDVSTNIEEGEDIEEYSMRILKKTYERRLDRTTNLSQMKEELAIQHLVNLREKDKKERMRRLETEKENSEPLQIGASRPEARSARLARLASQISSWEDDLSHPTIAKPPEVDPTRRDRFGNLGRKAPTPAAAGGRRQEARAAPARAAAEAPGKSGWDRAILDTLEAQGFARCESQQHLVFDYSEQQKSALGAKCISPSKQMFRSERTASPVKSSPVKPASRSTSPVKAPTSPVKAQISPVKAPSSPVKASTSSAALVRQSPPVRHCAVVAPKTVSQTAVQVSSGRGSPRKVKDMAAHYESSPSKTRDPAEMSLKERLALFEKNGGHAIMPKAALSMPIPQKALEKKTVNFQPVLPTRQKGLIAKVTQLQTALREERVHSPVRQEIESRKREMDMLRNMWKRPEHMEQGELIPEKEAEVPMPPPMPSQSSPMRNKTSSPLKVESNIAVLNDVRRIRVSPPKPGRLYPSVSDIETETETESEPNREEDETSFESETSANSEGSLGREIVEAALSPRHNQQPIASTLKRQSTETVTTNSSSSDESRVLQEIDDFLDEALGEPSPPKQPRHSFQSQIERGMVSYPSGSCHSTSFEFSRTSKEDADTSSSSKSSSEESTSEPQRNEGVRLVHTISLYRKQQQNSLAIAKDYNNDRVRDYDQIEIDYSTDDNKSCHSEMEISEGDLVSHRIKQLQTEVSRQQTVIAQTSQALNLCCSTIEFSGSVEQLEGEKLLLLASVKRQACLHEVERLKIEKCLRPGGGDFRAETGSLTVHNISIPVKMDNVKLHAREDKCEYVVCLIRCGSQVLGTDMFACTPKHITNSANSDCLVFRKPLKLDDLYADFTVSLEVYTFLGRSKELLPHDIKYHITTTPVSKKDKLRLTPKKGPKSETKLATKAIESLGGPCAVRSPGFRLAGYVVFSLRHISKRSHFSLAKTNSAPLASVLAGSLDLETSTDMTVSVEHRGFLTMFEDVSGFGAWHRRWCLLHSDSISYWKYPDDETKKIAIDSIELSQCKKWQVGPVSRDICARPNTFLLETKRAARPSDVDSLIMSTDGRTTTIRHLLSADTRQEMQEWCILINRTLGLLQTWCKN